jgi:hypothetical protein
MKLIARTKERALLQQDLDPKAPEFVAVVGRRRVGKTHLIRSFLQDGALHFEAADTGKTLLTTLVTTHGAQHNSHYLRAVQNEIAAEELFRR